MPVARQEIESPMLEDWEFTDELGIVLAIGRFIVPNVYSESVGSKMGVYQINDGRTVVGRTSTLSSVDAMPLKFIGIPYNHTMELKRRCGVIFKIRNYLGDYIWAVLESVEVSPMYGSAWTRTEQLYDITCNFMQVNPT